MTINILFASSYSELGGGETALLTLAQHLDSARFLPHLLVPRAGQLSQRWAALGWPVHILPWRGASVWFLPALWAQLPSSKRFTQLLRDQQINLVHSDYHTLPMLLPAAERAGIPTLWTCMGWWFQPKVWQRTFFKRPAFTFAHSEAIRQGFLGQPPFMPPERIEVLYPGVDTTRFHPNIDRDYLRMAQGIGRDTPLVAMIARFQQVKGHEVFQAMARQVATAMPDTRFIVAGENTQTAADSTYKKRILAQAQQDPLLRDRLSYLGFRPDVERIISAANVVVCASHFESYGVVNIETMACGRPVVSTNHGGPSETVLDGVTGYLVPPNMPDLLADKVLHLLQDTALCQAMGQAGRQRVETHFSGTANGQQFTTAVDMILGHA